MNQLSKETSPYLLQHQNNPVMWHAWNEKAWKKALEENKLVLVSIGYSACHWCHVMEHEVFEDEECASYMNDHFVCIKVDREERPDVDSIYMDAVHLMGSQGGWPLNVFTLPDGRPVYGGTYFPKSQWLNILENLVHMKVTEPARMEEYAAKLHHGLGTLNTIDDSAMKMPFDPQFVDDHVMKFSSAWDLEKGGMKRAPKFPMPNNYEFLLHHGVLAKNESVISFVNHTLTKMALGGIYDQIGGGFSRYSVDDIWMVPHFEKMLYDNAQLIGLYAKAFRQSGDQLFLETMTHSIEWVERELKSPEGLFYAALDADSEGVEGKFYVWTEQELKNILGEYFDFAKKYYSVGNRALWEHDQNILWRPLTDMEYMQSNSIDHIGLQSHKLKVRELLMNVRESRVRPGLDDKCIAGWNAMMVDAYVEAFRATVDERYLRSAEELMARIRKYFASDIGKIYHTYTKGVASINGFLDDYSCIAKASINLYEAGFDELHLNFAKQMMEKVEQLFLNDDNGLFYYTAADDEALIMRKMEVQDNVIPSSNSITAQVLFRLSKHFENERFATMCDRMLQTIMPQISYASAFSNWLMLYNELGRPFHEIVIAGPDSHKKMKSIQQNFIPSSLFAASTTESELPLFRHRFSAKSAIYVCTGKTCHAPVENEDDALALLN